MTTEPLNKPNLPSEYLTPSEIQSIEKENREKMNERIAGMIRTEFQGFE